jgi:dihydrofolate reductase
MIGIIAGVSSNGIIGKDNTMPFNYPEDLKFFRRNTIDSTIIMGRKTYESIGRPLPKRRNIVITKSNIDGVECFPSIKEAIEASKDNIWLIGGASIYEEGMSYADKLLLTINNDVVTGDNLVKFPWINPMKFKPTDMFALNDNLNVVTYTHY